LESAWESPKSIEQEMNIQELREREQGKVFSYFKIVCAQSYYIAIIGDSHFGQFYSGALIEK